MENDKKDKEGIKIDKASFISYKTNNISKDYTLGKTLGEGSFGTVRKAVHKATKQVFGHLDPMSMYYILNETDDLLCRVQSVHGCLGDVGDLVSENLSAHIIRLHVGYRLPVDNDVTAYIMKRSEVVSHKGQSQCGFTASRLSRDTE